MLNVTSHPLEWEKKIPTHLSIHLVNRKSQLGVLFKNTLVSYIPTQIMIEKKKKNLFFSHGYGIKESFLMFILGWEVYEIIWEGLVLVVIFLEVLVVESCDTDMYLLDIYRGL